MMARMELVENALGTKAILAWNVPINVPAISHPRSQRTVSLHSLQEQSWRSDLWLQVLQSIDLSRFFVAGLHTMSMDY